jgi:all-trans-8'-apo-beta-carotenal 15,15'-oxygenase
MHTGPTPPQSQTNQTPASPMATSVEAARSPATTDLGWMGALRDLPREHGFEPLRVDGTLPADLVGTLYRVGPALFSSFGKPYGHWFDGDGAVSAVRFANGRALGAAKLVQSEGLVKERRARRQLYGGYGTTMPGWRRFLPLAPTSKLKNVANTSILVWGERVFALYEGGPPTEIAPADLATLGEQDLGMAVETFSAHPHPVRSRRATYNFGIRYGRKLMLDLYELADSGRGRKLAEVPLARTTMIHDFVATEKYLVFFAPPLSFNPLRLLFGLDTVDGAMRWTPELGTDVLVVPIDDPRRLIRFTIDAFYQWHFLNAYERGDELVVDVVRYPNFDSNRWLGAQIQPHESTFVAGELWRVTVDPRTRRASSEPRWSHPCEFPRVAPAVQATRHTIGWLAANAAAAGKFVDRLPDAVAKIEVETGRASLWLSSGGVVSEPIFVPRPDARAEDDGWVLSLVYDPATDGSNVTVLDARDLAAGPLAKAWFDHHVPATYHGAFAQTQALTS